MFKKQRNFVTNLKRKKIKIYLNTIVSSKNNTSNIWKAINELTNKRKSVSSIKGISPDTLNKFFASTAERVISLDRSKENNLETLRNYYGSIPAQKLNFLPMSVVEVISAIKHLKQTSSKGVDQIDSKIL